MRRRTLMDELGGVTNYISAVYKPTSSTENTQIIGYDVFDTNGFRDYQIKTLYVDDVKLSSIEYYYSFNDTNEHTVMYVMYDDVSTLDWMFDNCSSLISVNLYNFDSSNVTSMYKMFYGCSGLTSIDLSNFNTNSVTDMSWMFFGCTGLTSINLSSRYTGKLTRMDYMFYGCSKLTSIDLYSFNTSNVTQMNNMFNGCTSLVEVVMTDDILNDTSTTSMFANITTTGTLYFNSDYEESYSQLTIPQKWNLKPLSYITATMYEEYSSKFETIGYHCNNSKTCVQYIDGQRKIVRSSTIILDWKTTYNIKVIIDIGLTIMRNLFEKCSGLTSIDLSNLDTSKVTDMYCMFYGCSGLTSIDLSNFDTSNVTNMCWMFYGCSGLTSIDLSPLDTSKVTNMSYMFYACTGLTTVDMSYLDMSKVNNTSYMFGNCSGLTSVKFGIRQYITTRTTSMFYNITTTGTLYYPSESYDGNLPFICAIPSTWTAEAY